MKNTSPMSAHTINARRKRAVRNGLRTWRTAAAAVALTALACNASGATDDADARWQSLKQHYFQDREILPGEGVIELEAPYRAHDAALVPVSMKAGFPQSPERHIRSIMLLIDKNPVPMAGHFKLTPQSGLAAISTRVRVNEYSHVRAVAETSDGKLYMATRFVKASGGCSAPASKDLDNALTRLGKMKLRQSPAIVGEPSQAQILISHPNTTGMQVDQVTQHYIPAHYIENIDIKYAGQSVLNIETNISMSEDPSIHFYFTPSGSGELSVEATDTDDKTFTKTWQVTPARSSVAAVGSAAD